MYVIYAVISKKIDQVSVICRIYQDQDTVNAEKEMNQVLEREAEKRPFYGVTLERIPLTQQEIEKTVVLYEGWVQNGGGYLTKVCAKDPYTYYKRAQRAATCFGTVYAPYTRLKQKPRGRQAIIAEAACHLKNEHCRHKYIEFTMEL